MVTYLDSSAAVKLAHREHGSEQLVAWLNSRPDLEMVSSVLVEVELYRALQRYDPAALPNVPQVLARLVRVELNATIRAMAGGYQQPLLRSLDAIHLATARYVELSGAGQLAAFVAYDARLLEFAANERFQVTAPGL
ncbi:MAG TPA: type II toxin-antitoxin system VapC family toxin [Chloroflexota bacterium]